MKTKQMITVTSAEPLRDFVVRLGFSDGSLHEVDLKDVLWGPVFQPLKDDPKLFRKLRVDRQLGTIVWPNEADLAPEVLYARAKGRNKSKSMTERERISKMAKSKPERRIVQPNKERGGWDVVKPKAQRASAHTKTQAQAAARAKQIVENRGGGEVTIKGADGKIRNSNTTPKGNDPNPPKDKR